jgi:hypothetical protein
MATLSSAMVVRAMMIFCHGLVGMSAFTEDGSNGNHRPSSKNSTILCISSRCAVMDHLLRLIQLDEVLSTWDQG